MEPEESDELSDWSDLFPETELIAGPVAMVSWILLSGMLDEFDIIAPL